MNSLKSQVDTLAKNEVELRKQLNVYVDKFKQVEETLNKSNELFTTFRKEMEQVCLFWHPILCNKQGTLTFLL